MMEFWLIAATMILVAMAIVAIPMIRAPRQELVSDQDANVAYFREQEQELAKQVEQGLITADDAQQVRAELEKKLLNDMAGATQASYQTGGNKWLAVAVALLVPALAIPLYMQLGAGTEMNVTRLMMSGEASPQEVTQALEGWRDKRPENAQVLYVLGGRYLSANNYQQAQDAFQQLYQVTGGSPDAAAELAQAVFLANNNTITERVRTLYQEALLKDGDNITALGLQGIDAFSQQDYRLAITAWRKAMQLEPELAGRQALMASINHAQTLLGEAPAQVRVNIALAPDLQKQLATLPPTAKVIVFARQAGTRTPIAAVPVPIGDLPKQIVLDENAAMVMGGTLDGIKQVDVVARVSLDGDVSSSDYQGEVKGVAVGSDQVVELLIPAGL